MPSISINLSTKEQFSADVMEAEGHGHFVSVRAGYDVTIMMPGFGRVTADACEQLAAELVRVAAIIRATPQSEPATEVAAPPSIDDDIPL